MLGHNVGDFAKVRLNADGSPVVAHTPGTVLTGSYNGSGWKGHNLYWLKTQRPELFAASTSKASPGFGNPTVPGFQEYCEGWLVDPQSEEFIDTGNMQRFAKDSNSGRYYRVQEGINWDPELNILAEASASSGSKSTPPCRKVLIADLHRAASVLSYDMSHHDRPAAVFAVFDTSGASSIIEAAAKNFHTQLLPRLADFRGEWSPGLYKAALAVSLHESLGAAKDPSAAAGVSAAAALFLGSKLTVIAFGPGARCVVSAALQDQLPGPSVLSVHGWKAGSKPATEDARDLVRCTTNIDGSADAGNAHSAAETPKHVPPRKLPAALILAVSEARAARRVSGVSTDSAEAACNEELGSVTAHFDLDFGGQFQCLTLMANAVGSLTGLPDNNVVSVAEQAVAYRRPRAGCTALVKAARDRGAKASLVVAMVNFVWSSSPEPACFGPPVKRPRTEAHDKVRARHILLRHAAAVAPQDPVRHRRVTRSLEEAEMQLLTVLQDLDRDPTQFTSKCRELSECQSSLKGGEFAGDLGWLSREKPQSTPPEVHKVAFLMSIGQVSDLIMSKNGVHIVMRTA